MHIYIYIICIYTYVCRKREKENGNQYITASNYKLFRKIILAIYEIIKLKKLKKKFYALFYLLEQQRNRLLLLP